MRRLGVARALVGGAWVRGDVAVHDDGTVGGVGLDGGPLGDWPVAAPGFVDLQVNGYGGVDVRTAGPEGLRRMADSLAATGVVAFQPTCYSAPQDSYLAVIASAAAVDDRPRHQVRILPPHLEGPFLSRSWAGAHDPGRLLAPSPGMVEQWLATGPVGMVTLAPELEGSAALIHRLVASGVVVSLGHSDATATQADAAFGAGVTAITHWGNAHRRFAPRDPGPLAAALVDPRVTVCLIADMHHLAAHTIRLAFAAAPGRVAVVTDAVAPTGTAAVRWDVDGVTVGVVDGRAGLADGTLAGSVTTMDRSLRNLLGVGVPDAAALAALGTTPARLSGRGPHDLAPGSPADLVILDQHWDVRTTLVGGGEAFAG